MTSAELGLDLLTYASEASNCELKFEMRTEVRNYSEIITRESTEIGIKIEFLSH